MKTVARVVMLCLLLVICGSQSLWAATAPSGETAQGVMPEAAARPPGDLRSWRLTLDMGGWASGDGTASVVMTDDGIESHNGGFLGGVSAGYRLAPEWMATFGVTSRLLEAHDGGRRDAEDFDRASFLTTVSVGARFYLPPLAARSVAKPYLSAGIGPTFGTEVESRDWDRSDDRRRHGDRRRRHDADITRSQAVFSGHLGAGVDIQPTSWLVFGTHVAYHFAPKFDQPVGGRRDPSGFTFAFEMGVNVGRRLPAPGR